MKGKKPGPFGKGKDNFKCEYAKETLYVSKVDYTSDKKCFYVFKTDCKYEYGKGKDIGFKKECSEFSSTKVRMTLGMALCPNLTSINLNPKLYRVFFSECCT